jgi:hypothetical protein
MSTLETRLRDHFEQVAARDQPPSNVSIAAASSRGQSALRWRGARRIGVPALAASAVLAVALAGVLPVADARRPPGAQLAGVHGQLNPLIPYAAFSWLPAGERVSSGGSSRTSVELSTGVAGWQLAVYARGQCHRTMHAPGAIHGRPAPWLVCGSLPLEQYALTGTAPAVRGHEAFWGPAFGPEGKWIHSALVWTYESGGWAVLSRTVVIKHPVQTIFRIADGVMFGSPLSQPDRFAVQLTHVPADWRVSTAYFQRSHGMQLAYQYYVTTSTAASLGVRPGWQFSANLPFLDIFKSESWACYFYPGGSRGSSVRQVINGYHVILTHFPALKGAYSGLPWEQLCAPDADGLTVMISSWGTHPEVPLTTLFRNMKLLGLDRPSNWTTQPLR